uniref:Uncharacterized protein n=1 Tax=Lactuca sativa TaxID=4236 RepID=A0A9R1W614_LACSA|nr:hypothetical protein LSAT_V11C300106790 [Lactuca sativa]
MPSRALHRSSNKGLLRLSSTSTATSFKNGALLLWECCCCANLIPHETLVVVFYACPKMVDPPLCQRSTVIIPGLLRTINRYEVEVSQLKMCLLASWVLFLLFVLFWN